MELVVYDAELFAENWVWWALSAFLLLARFGARLRTVGLRGLQGDDLFAFGILFFVTLDTVCVHLTLFHGQNLSVVVTPEILPFLTESEIKDLEYGSKIEFLAWHSYISLIWCMKFTMLFFFKRLTFGSFHAKMVKYLMILCGVTYFIMLMVVSFGCRPYSENWQVTPIASWACSFRPQNTLAVSVLNVSTDAAILSIPIPMLWKLKVPWRKKIVIAAILSSGIFVIAAAIIRAVITMGGTPTFANINRWSIRETMLGIITVNVPILRPIFTRAFWRPGPYDPTNTHRTTGYTNTKSTGGMSKNDIEMANQDDKKTYQVGVLSHSSSQENIILSDRREKDDDVVVVHTTLNIENSHRDEASFSEDGKRGWTNIGGPR